MHCTIYIGLYITIDLSSVQQVVRGSDQFNSSDNEGGRTLKSPLATLNNVRDG